jgi:hypothetical protein
MKPLVSILIPAYSAATWISDTLRSAIAKTGGAQRNHCRGRRLEGPNAGGGPAV